MAGIQRFLNGQLSRRRLRNEVQAMLEDGYRPGSFRLTHAKFKPGRKLRAYFTFPVLSATGQTNHSVHLAVAWQQNLDGTNHTDDWSQVQEQAREAGLMPVQQAMWRSLLEEGIKLQMWPFDPEFPHLVRLSSSSHVAGMLTSFGIAHDPNQLPVITPIRFQPGKRHVLRYEICAPGTPPGGPQRWYAKLYPNGQDAASAFGVANRVVDWLAANYQGLQGNRPEVMSQEDSVILYPHAAGIPLFQQFHRSRRWLAEQLQTIGRSLAILHTGPETLQADLKQNNFANEVKVVKRASEHIQVLLPETYEKIVEILDQAHEIYSSLSQEKATFTHADFKSEHILSTRQGLTLIDFDTCTLADPALDIGKFLADIDWWFTLKEISGAKEAQSELLKGYLGSGRPDQLLYERLARAKLFYVLILTKIVARRVPIYKKEWATVTTRMIARVAQVLHNRLEV